MCEATDFSYLVNEFVTKNFGELVRFTKFHVTLQNFDVKSNPKKPSVYMGISYTVTELHYFFNIFNIINIIIITFFFLFI